MTNETNANELVKIITNLAELEYNHTAHSLAKLIFPENKHIQERAKDFGNRLLAFYGYLDSGNRKIFAEWVQWDMDLPY